MISEEIKEKINYDFKDINNVINDNDHIVRKYYIEFLNGNYGDEIYNGNMETCGVNSLFPVTSYPQATYQSCPNNPYAD